MAEWNPKDYHDDGHILTWDKDLTADQMEALRGGEIFTLMAPDGITPHCRVLMDSYDAIRDSEIKQEA